MSYGYVLSIEGSKVMWDILIVLNMTFFSESVWCGSHLLGFFYDALTDFQNDVDLPILKLNHIEVARCLDVTANFRPTSSSLLNHVAFLPIVASTILSNSSVWGDPEKVYPWKHFPPLHLWQEYIKVAMFLPFPETRLDPEPWIYYPGQMFLPNHILDRSYLF